MKIKLSEKLSLPPDAVTQTIVVYGGKGMGKTNLGGVLVEGLAHARKRFAVIDPVGVWYGLQHGADGKTPGLEVLVLGGKHGDIPIEPTGGAVVADLVADEDVDVVIDISRRRDGRMWGIGERTRFVTDYCIRLYERQGERRRPIMQVIDEAGRFVPQMIPHGSPDLAKCVSAIERMVEEGRNVGIGVTLITQRSARMNKSVSELAECMIAFRTVGPRSVDAILDWLGEHVEKARWKILVEELRSLPRGCALVVSPGWLNFEGVVPILPRTTFDSSATPTGDERRATGKASKPDLSKYRDRMSETVERASLDDPKILRARLKELEAKLAKSVAAPAPAAPPKEVQVPVPFVPPLLVSKVREAAYNLEALATSLGDALVNAKGVVKNAPKLAAPSGFTSPTRPAAPQVKATRRSSASPPPGLDGWVPPKCEAALLRVLAARRPSKTTYSQLAILSGYSVNSSSFANGVSALRSHGAAVGGRDGIEITHYGDSLAGPVPMLPTGPELVKTWGERLAKAERTFLFAIYEAYPTPLTKDELAERTGYSTNSSSFANALSTLRTLELITRGADLGLGPALSEAVS